MQGVHNQDFIVLEGHSLLILITHPSLSDLRSTCKFFFTTNGEEGTQSTKTIYFVSVNQHGGYDVTGNPTINELCFTCR